MSEKEMFKQMEMGKLLAEDVLPKVAKEYARVARENGALDAAVTKVNSQYQRFLSAVTRLKVELFEGGFGQAMGDTFGKLSEFINDNKSSLIAFGNIAVGIFQAIAAAVWTIVQPLALVGSLFTAAFGEDGAKIVGWALGVALLASKIKLLAMGLAALNIPLLITSAKIIAISTAVIGLTEAIAYLTTGKTISSRIAETYSVKAANQIAQQVGGRSNSSQTVNVVVETNDSEFGRAINARYDERQRMARMQMEAEVTG